MGKRTQGLITTYFSLNSFFFTCVCTPKKLKIMNKLLRDLEVGATEAAKTLYKKYGAVYLRKLRKSCSNTAVICEIKKPTPKK